MNVTLRTTEGEEKYQKYLAEGHTECCFCREMGKARRSQQSSIKREWKYWALMINDYPYDKVYSVHDMLFPLRHVDFEDLTVKEVSEYNRILKELREEYHQSLENFGDRQSQKSHYHIHFCKFI